jgi:hypothetical protein
METLGFGTSRRREDEREGGEEVNVIEILYIHV